MLTTMTPEKLKPDLLFSSLYSLSLFLFIRLNLKNITEHSHNGACASGGDHAREDEGQGEPGVEDKACPVFAHQILAVDPSSTIASTVSGRTKTFATCAMIVMEMGLRPNAGTTRPSAQAARQISLKERVRVSIRPTR